MAFDKMDRKKMAQKSHSSKSRKWMPSESKIEAAGHEIKENPPKILAKTKAKKGAGAANKQRVAIMLSKARA